MRIRPRYVAEVAIVILAVVVGSALLLRLPVMTSPDLTATPTGSPSPSPAAHATASLTATATPTPSPAPGSDRYGLIVGKTVRSEADARKLGEIATEHFTFIGAVSPDGRRVAYWETPVTGRARVLRLLDGSIPSQPRVVLTLAETEFASVSTGGGVVWSSDGTGLLIAVNSLELAWQGPPVDAPPLYAALRQVDIASGSVKEIARSEKGSPF